LVADTGNKRVVLLRIRKGDLKFVRNIGSGVLEQPMDVAITPDELVFVTDAILGEILIFDLEGKFIRSIAKGVLNDPCGIDIDHEKLPKSRYRHNKIFVVDSLGKRINVLDFEGNLLQRTNLAKLGFPNGVSRYIALDYDNNVFMPDTVLHKIHKLDMELNHIVSMGKKGKAILSLKVRAALLYGDVTGRFLFRTDFLLHITGLVLT
jgi:DNA-binding beta-propeller fold protein YncE